MVPITARPKAQRCVRRRTRASYLPVGRTWRHAGAAAEVLEAVPPLGIAAPAPKRSTTQPILASSAHLESPMGTTCPPPPPWLQASRSMTTRDEPGCPSRRSGAAGLPWLIRRCGKTPRRLQKVCQWRCDFKACKPHDVSTTARCRRIRIRPMKCLHFIDFVDFGRLRALRPRRQTPPQTHLRAQDAHISPYSDLATLLGLLG